MYTSWCIEEEEEEVGSVMAGKKSTVYHIVPRADAPSAAPAAAGAAGATGAAAGVGVVVVGGGGGLTLPAGVDLCFFSLCLL